MWCFQGERRFTLPLPSAPAAGADHMMPRRSSCPWTGLVFAVEQCLPPSVASSPFVLPLRLIEWCAVRPTGLPAGGLPASIARTSPSQKRQSPCPWPRKSPLESIAAPKLWDLLTPPPGPPRAPAAAPAAAVAPAAAAGGGSSAAQLYFSAAATLFKVSTL